MAKTVDLEDLRMLVRQALAVADALELTNPAIYLDRALLELETPVTRLNPIGEPPTH